MLAYFATNPALAIASAAVFGLLVGSFLNVVILRLPLRMQWAWEHDCREFLKSIERAPSNAVTDAADANVTEPASESAEPTATSSESKTPPGIVVERSHCPRCNHQLSAWENIPLLSFLALGGKCRHCKVKISWQYPFIEALTGLLFALVVWRYGITWQSGALLVVTGFFVAMSGIDARTTLLPDTLTLPLLWLGLLVSLVPLFVSPSDAILGAVVGYLSLWSVYWAFKLLTGKEGMGFGDFKLLAAIGAFCGWKAILPVVLMSSVIGAIVGITLIAVQGRDRATPIPFGPYLAAAGWIQMLYGGELLGAYLSWLSG